MCLRTGVHQARARASARVCVCVCVCVCVFLCSVLITWPQVSSRYFGGVNVVKRLLRRGLHVTVNSDDPAYFGGYVGDNFVACVKELGLSAEEVIALAENSFKASFIGDDEKAAFIAEVRAHAERVL